MDITKTKIITYLNSLGTEVGWYEKEIDNAMKTDGHVTPTMLRMKLRREHEFCEAVRMVEIVLDADVVIKPDWTVEIYES